MPDVTADETTTAPVQAPAHGKLNLCLSVGPAQAPGTVHEGKNVSGFHKVASWMACIDLHDDIELARKAEGQPSTFTIGWAADAPRPTPIDWAPTKDLAFRAHEALQARVGRALPADLSVTKRIPVGSGLGGGSSDAATTLLLLNQVFELGLSAPQLREVAFTLGSDVAFFIDGGDEDNEGGESEEPAVPRVARAALVSSFGEVIERADPVDSCAIVVIPPFSCATRGVYGAFDELLAMRVESKRAQIAVHKGQEAADAYQAQDARDDLVVRRIEKALRSGSLDSDSLFNDLFLPAVHVEPRVGRLVTALSRATRTPAHLTGSGSAAFLITDGAKAEKLLAKVRKTLDSLAAGADEFQSEGLVGGSFVALATRLL
jgi:4-diphosphocytidyl-2-C-methyl-D-erythritol kinase